MAKMVRPGKHNITSESLPGATQFVVEWFDAAGNRTDSEEFVRIGKATGFDKDNQYVGMLTFLPPKKAGKPRK